MEKSYKMQQNNFQQTNKTEINHSIDNHIKFEVSLHFLGIWPTVCHGTPGTPRDNRPAYLFNIAQLVDTGIFQCQHSCRQNCIFFHSPRLIYSKVSNRCGVIFATGKVKYP